MNLKRSCLDVEAQNGARSLQGPEAFLFLLCLVFDDATVARASSSEVDAEVEGLDDDVDVGEDWSVEEKRDEEGRRRSLLRTVSTRFERRVGLRLSSFGEINQPRLNEETRNKVN